MCWVDSTSVYHHEVAYSKSLQYEIIVARKKTIGTIILNNSLLLINDLDESHDQRRGRDQQWDDRRGDDRYMDDRRVDDRRLDTMRDRYNREMDPRTREGPTDRRQDMR